MSRIFNLEDYTGSQGFGPKQQYRLWGGGGGGGGGGELSPPRGAERVGAPRAYNYNWTSLSV